MAKKPAKKAAAKKAAPAVKNPKAAIASMAGDAIQRDAFLSLIRRCKSPENKIAEYRGELGGIIADACEHKKLHKKAFSWARQMQRMDGVKLGEFLFHFDLYREYLEIDKAAAADMLEDRKVKDAEAKAEQREADRAAKAEAKAAKAGKPTGADDTGGKTKADMRSDSVQLAGVGRGKPKPEAPTLDLSPPTEELAEPATAH